MNAMNCLLMPRALSAGALEKAYARKLIREFYMRPGVTFSYLGLLLQQSGELRSPGGGTLAGAVNLIKPGHKG